MLSKQPLLLHQHHGNHPWHNIMIINIMICIIIIKTSSHVHGAPPQKPLRVWKCFRSRQFFEKRWSRGNFQNFHFNFSAPVSNRLDHYDAVVIHLLLICPAHWLCLHDRILPLKKLWKKYENKGLSKIKKVSEKNPKNLHSSSLPKPALTAKAPIKSTTPESL